MVTVQERAFDLGSGRLLHTSVASSGTPAKVKVGGAPAFPAPPHLQLVSSLSPLPGSGDGSSLALIQASAACLISLIDLEEAQAPPTGRGEQFPVWSWALEC